MYKIYKCIHSNKLLSYWRGSYYLESFKDADSSLCYDIDINALFEACEELDTNFEVINVFKKL